VGTHIVAHRPGAPVAPAWLSGVALRGPDGDCPGGSST